MAVVQCAGVGGLHAVGGLLDVSPVYTWTDWNFTITTHHRITQLNGDGGGGAVVHIKAVHRSCMHSEGKPSL